ncbi:MAG: cell envelope integrity protein TolA [Gammaproteobacteria bacterium]|nr:cell envelope integrity protein TolA [Gammaproteobacteria bacterium]
MLFEFKQYPLALVLSVLLHIVLLAIALVSLDSDEKEKLIKQGEQVKTVKARVVDQQQLEAAKKRKQAEIDREKKAVAAEQQRKANAERKKREEAKRKADEKKKKQVEAKKEVERKNKALAEVRRKEKEKQAKAAEVKRIAEEKKEAEAQQLADEKKQAEAKQRRLAEEEQKRKQAEIKAAIEAEETERRLNSLREAYKLAIEQKIVRNWRRPQESGKIPYCEVRVLQGPGGIILDVTFGNCEAGTNTYRASIENAVYRAEPLPTPGDPALFERELIILFNPE